MSLLRRLLGETVPESCRVAFARDLTAVSARSLAMVLAMSLGAQLVQALGGGDGHVAFLRSAVGAGLLLSLLYVRLGRGRSPLAMLFWPEAVAACTVMSIAFVVGRSASPATAFAGLAFLAVASASIGIPFAATVYGLVYPEGDRAHLIAYGRMLGGLTAIVSAWGFGRLFAASPTDHLWVFSLVGAFSLFAFYRFSRMQHADARARQPASPPSALSILRRDKNFRRFQGFQFLLGFANLATVPVVDLYVRRELGLTIDQAVLVVWQGVVIQGMVLLTVRFNSSLFNRHGVVRHRVMTSCLIGLALVVWAFADSLWLAVLAAALAGLGMAGGQIIWMIGSLQFASRDELAAYSGIHTFLTGLRALVAPTVGVALLRSPLLDGNHRAYFLLAAAAVFVSALGHALWVEMPKRPPT